MDCIDIYDAWKLLTTILAIPNERLTVTEKSAFAFWETSAGQPKALRAWFNPAELGGQEFAWTKAVAIAAVAHAQVASTEAKEEPAFKSAPVVEVTPEGTETPVPQASVEVAQASPPPAPNPAEEEVVVIEALPKTASPSLIGLADLVFLAGFGVMRVARYR